MTSEEDLGKAVKNDQDSINIEGDLAKKIIRIQATGKVAWAVCIGCFAIAIAGIIATPATGGTSAMTASAFVAPAIGILGLGTTTTCVSIALATGSVGALNKLRKYRIEKISDKKIILHRK